MSIAVRWLAFTIVAITLGCRDQAPPTRLGPLHDTAAFRQARMLVNSSRFAAAAAEYGRLRDSFAARGDTVNQWHGQLWWAESMTRGGEPDSAARGLAVADRLAGSDPRRQAWVAIMRSKLNERIGQLDSAIAIAERAIAMSTDLGDLEISFWAYDMLGTALSMRGRFREALAADSTSLAFRQSIPAPTRVIAGGYNEVAIGYRHLGRYDEAQAALEESHRLARSVDDTLVMALARANLANVWDAVGDRDRAIVALLEAKRYLDAIGHRRLMVASGNQLAAHLLEGGNPDSARAVAQRSVDIAQATRNVPGEVDALETVIGADLAQNRFVPARRSLLAAIATADRAGLGSNRVDLRSLLVTAEIALRNVAAAREAAEMAVRIADSLGDPSVQFTAIEARGRALEAARDPGAAAGFGAAMDLLESLRGRLALGDLRMGVAAPRLGAYEGAIRTFLAAGQPLEAFHAAERARARLLLELMADRAVVRPASPRDRLRAGLKEAYQTRNSVDEPGLIERLDRQIASLGDSLAALEGAAAVADPVAVARHGSVLSPEAIRSALLGGDRAILAYFWGERSVFGWWITADSVRAVDLGSVASLAPTVDFLRGALERRDDRRLWRVAGARAYRQLVAPLGPTPTATVLVIADGPLSRVPFESFLPDSLGEPWGAGRQISYGPSASVVASLTQAPRATWSRNLLAVGNPVIGTADTARVLAAENLRAAGLGALPYAETEARAIHQLLDGGGGDLLIGERATLDRWLDREPGRYRYLHFALHAVASDRHPDAGALLFAGRPLDLAAVHRLRLRAELATLSACETGIGRWVRGEGVIGMQHAFLAAGARNVVVTLWRVADRSTADFMREFYTELKAGRSPAEALAHVKTGWIRSGGERAHPWRWAPFVLVGPTR
ncbi:MAG: CHAT domain-containing protein [Gemmatimonadales bacterium]